MTPTLSTLLKRLADYGVIAHDLTSTDDVAMLIRHARLEMTICAPAVINGRKQALNFEQYYREVFGMGLDGKRKR